MQVRLLGPVELWGAGGRVDLGAPQQRCVFTVLAMSPRQTVSVDALVDRVWGDQLPRNVRTVLYTYVSRLRRQLRRANGAGGQTVLRHRDGGYALEVDPEQVDLHRARRLATEARAARRRPDGTERAAELLAQACDLWVGPPLAGVTSDWAERVRVGLEHEWRALLTERYDAAIRAGQHQAVIGPLSESLAAYPLTEPLAALLMLALHRSGRPTEALEVYAQLRRRMLAELGGEPGEPLRRLHERMLRRDPSLEQPRPGRPAPWVTLCQLPPDTWHFIGRDRLCQELAAAVEADPEHTAVPVVTITGLPGAGKTALAVRVAHRIRGRFPDGQWHVRLSGADGPRDPVQVLGELLEASGADPRTIPAGLERRTAALRTRVADRRVLILLDGAASAAQVRPLLPGTAGAAVLVTSRQLLAGLAAAAAVRLGPLAPVAALELLRRLAGPDRVAAEPEAAAEISAACGRLPLALRIAGARLAARPEWRLARLAGLLRDRRRRLDELAIGDLAVRPGLASSVEALDPLLRTALRRLAPLGSGAFPTRTAAALAADPSNGAGPAGRAGDRDGDRLIDALMAANLVDPVGTDAGEPRYRLPELVAAYAVELVDDAEAGFSPPHRAGRVGPAPDAGGVRGRPGGAGVNR
ncbi:MAG: hypothetical protein GEV12_14715 [Micromonosporaceae bacterium]|nr:hypothetical protein [Micromonosporaceae bacterium]